MALHSICHSERDGEEEKKHQPSVADEVNLRGKTPIKSMVMHEYNLRRH